MIDYGGIKGRQVLMRQRLQFMSERGAKQRMRGVYSVGLPDLGEMLQKGSP